MKHAVTENFVDATDPRGEVSAHTFVTVVDIFGRERWRRVSLGRRSATLGEAKQMIAWARDAQPEKQIMAQFTIHL